MNYEEIFPLFSSIYAGLDDEYRWLVNNKPLMAHYTSISVLENILKGGEIWFSNPLFMNDLEEMRHGINKGYSFFMSSECVARACKTIERLVSLGYKLN
jgi:hypothetical protein